MLLKCFGSVLICLINLIYCAANSEALLFEETFIIRYFEERKIVPVKVDLDFRQKIEIIRTLNTNNSWIPISLLDFIKETKAFKDVDGSQCFISSAAGETIEEDRKKLQQLNNGIVKGSYIPTFYILKEIDHKTNISEKFGKRIAEFCSGSLVSLVSREGTLLSRKKRQVSNDGDKNKFTHHSYGHYGHQSNNYAHYGHDTRITGTIDKNGNIKDHTMTQSQERSQSSQTYPLRRTVTPPHSSTRNGGNTFSTYIPNQNTYSSEGNRGFITGGDSSGQYSLQTAQESGYQLNLPFGLKTGNAYRGGLSSSGQYEGSRGKPYQSSQSRHDMVHPGQHRYSSSAVPGSLFSSSPGSHSISSSPGLIQPGSSFLSSPAQATDQKIALPNMHTEHGRSSPETKYTYPLPQSVSGIQQPGHQTSSHTSFPVLSPHSQIQTAIPNSESQSQLGMQRHEHTQGVMQPSVGYQPGLQTATILNGQQTIASSDSIRNGRHFTRPASEQNLRNSEFQSALRREQHPLEPRPVISHQPRVPSIATKQQSQPVESGYLPSSFLRTPVTGRQTGVSGYQPSLLPGTLVNAAQPIGSRYEQSSIPSPGSLSTSLSPDSSPQSSFTGHPTRHFSTDVDQQRFGGSYQQPVPQPISGDSIPKHFDSNEGASLDSGYNIQGPQISQPRYPDSHVLTDQRQIPTSEVNQQISRDSPTIGSSIPTNLKTFDSAQSRPSGISGDRLGIGQIDSTGFPYSPSSGAINRQQPAGTFSYNAPDLSSQGTLDGSRVGQNEPDRTSLVGTDVASERRVGDSASSQTQVQTGAEGTAAEASSAGQYRGVASKTQVQGGYAGNGSFSAQAQSGFSGGITQSQVQGGKQGGLSGSSAMVENVGSAQSQVQVSRPSGSASSTAEGRFSYGMTNVRAQSGRTGGSAGAASQSTGLSSSQVQVDIAGKEATDNSDFQGTVSASVLGGRSSGQSQTQLQGGYNSGRKYAATAQGGFDASMDYRGSVQTSGTNPLLAGQTSDGDINTMQTSYPSATLRGINDDGSPAKADISAGKDISQDIYGQTASRASYPPQSMNVYPNSQFTRPQPAPSLSKPPGYITPISESSGTLQTDFAKSTFPFNQQYPSVPAGQPLTTQHNPRGPYETPITSQFSNNADQHSHLTTIPHQPGHQLFPQPLPEFSPQTHSMGLQGRDGVMTPSLHSQGASQPSSSIIGAQKDFLTPHYSRQFGQPLSPYDTQTQNGNLREISIKRDQTSDAGVSNGDYSNTYPPSHFRPGQYQPTLQMPASSNGYLPDQNLHPRIDHLPTPTGSLEGSSYFSPLQYQPTLQVPSSSNDYVQPQRLSPPTATGISRSDGAQSIAFPHSDFSRSGQSSSLVPISRQGSIPGSYTTQHQPSGTISGSHTTQPQLPGSIPGSQHQPSSSDRDRHVPISRQASIPGSYTTQHQPSGTISGSHPTQPQLPGSIPGSQHQLPSSGRDHYVPSSRQGSIPGSYTTQPQPPGTHTTQPQLSGSIPGSQHQPSSSGRDHLGQQLPTQSPGVREPDSSEEGGCCEALKNLKRRCCGRSAQKQSSSCCSSARDDVMLDFEEEDMTGGTSDKQPCKVIKAICYIVYKPIGKARICKPTTSNSC